MKHIGWSSNDFGFYSGSARFESQQGPNSSCPSFLWLFWPLEVNITVFWLRNDCLLLYPFQFITHWSAYHSEEPGQHIQYIEYRLGKTQQGREMSVFSKIFRPALGTEPASCSEGTGGSCPEVKWPECETDHLPQSSTKVKNEWSCTSTPLIYLHPVFLYLLCYHSTLYSMWYWQCH
jgi:hypothetical protein